MTLTVRPSQLHRVQHCSGSAVMEQHYPEEQSDDARDGDAAHWAFAEQLNGRVVAEGQITPAGVTLTAEMLEACDVGLDYVQRKTNGMMGSLMIEHAVYPKRIHPDMKGKLDVGAWLFPASRRPHLFLADFKYGHRFVDAYENAQLIAYACGMLDETKYEDQAVDVTLAIIQPRCYQGGAVREWHVPAAELRGHINRLQMAVEDAHVAPVTRVNMECIDCKARHACPTFQADAYRTLQYSGSAVPFNLPVEAAGLELRWLEAAEKRLKGRITGLSAQIEAQLKDGQRVPWWRLESTAGREVWRNPAEALVMGETMGLSVARPVEPITPAQARKAGIPAEVVAEYAHRPTGGVKLVADEGGTSLARVFGMAANGT